jgi:O-antigen/teichoic acid export membrane protein
MFGMQFAAFGMGAALTKYVAQFYDDTKKTSEYITSGIIGSTISGTLIGIALYFSSSIIAIDFFDIPTMEELLKVTALCFPFIAIQKAVIGTLNGYRKMRAFALVNIIQNVSVVLLSLGLVLLLNMNVLGAVIGYVVPTIVIGTCSLYLTRHDMKPSSFMGKTVLREISWFGFYVVLANSIGLINTQIDSLLIGYFMDETEVGYYAVAVLFMQLLLLMPQAIQRITTPSISAYYGKGNLEEISELIKKTILKTAMLIVPIMALLAISGQFLIEIIFTEEFLPAYTPLLILLIGYSIYAVFVSIGTCLSSMGKVNMVFKISFVCALINTTLNVLLIPQYGLIGAASATTASLLFTTLINMIYIYKYTSEKHICGI